MPTMSSCKKQQRLTYEEILKVARAAVALGVSKIRLTGGEPLLDKNLLELIHGLAKLPAIDDLALTTNGMLLAPMAEKLADAGLHRVTVSLDSLDAAVFRRMSGGRGDLAKVLAGIEAAERGRLSPIKINVVVQRGVNDHTIMDLLEHFRGSAHIVRLIEFMDVGNRNGWRMDQVVPSRQLLRPDHAALAVAAYRPELSGRGGAPLCLRGWPRGNRLYLVGDRAVLRRLQSRAFVGGRRALHLPVCDAGNRSARGTAKQCGRERTYRYPVANLAATRRSLQ